MKKLNKKGFTLIELLAVIVILAIIVVVTVPTVLNSIEDARRSSLNSLAEEIANWYDTSYAQDQLGLGDKILGGMPSPDKVKCLGEIEGDFDGVKKSLADIYGLSQDDLILKLTRVNFADGAVGNVCSNIKLVNGKAVVVLFGNEGGKFGTLISEKYSSYNIYSSYVNKE